MGQNNSFDLFRADLFSASVNKVLLSTFNNIIAGRMLPHQISRLIETVAGKHSRVVLWSPKISPQRVRSSTAKFTHFAKGYVSPVSVENTDFVIRRNRAPHCL